MAGELPRAPSRVEAFRVGRWTVEPSLHQISADGAIVKVEPKAMALLCLLAERPGQVVARDTLMESVWPGVVVGDDALTQVVVKLRRALGDARDEPTYIQTIPKGGYRLVAPVLRTRGEEGPVADLAAVAVAGGRAGRRLWRVTAATAAGLALLGAGAAWWAASVRAPAAASDRVPGDAIQASAAAWPTVVIQPFEPLSRDAQEALLARGITADLVTDLSKVSGLWVVARTPAGALGDDDTLAAVAAARYLVSGTVQRIADRLRVQVHLSDSRTGRQLWSQRFDRALSGVFAIQDELGPELLQLLPVQVDEAEIRRVAQRYTRSLEAYEAFHRGHAALHVRRREDNETARQLFWRALDLDAGFARAYAGLAMTYVADYRNQWAIDRAAALDRALDLARTAHQIDPDIAETYGALAFVHVYRHQHAQALALLEEALRRHPSFADGYATTGGIYTSIGRPAEGVAMLRTAIRLAPESGYTYLMLLGRAYLFLGDHEQARVNLQQALSRNPGVLDARVYLAAAHLAAGDRDAAAWEAEEIRAQQPGFTARGWLETNPTADPRLRDRLIGALAELGL